MCFKQATDTAKDILEDNLVKEFMSWIFFIGIGRSELKRVKLTVDDDKLYLKEKQYLKGSISHMARSSLIANIIIISAVLLSMKFLDLTLIHSRDMFIISLITSCISIGILYLYKKEILHFNYECRYTGLLPMLVTVWFTEFVCNRIAVSYRFSNSRIQNLKSWIILFLVYTIVWLIIHFIILRPRKIVKVNVNYDKTVTNGIDGTKDCKIILNNGSSIALNLYSQNLDFTSDNDLWIINAGYTYGEKSKETIYLKEDVQEIQISNGSNIDIHIKYNGKHWTKL